MLAMSIGFCKHMHKLISNRKSIYSHLIYSENILQTVYDTKVYENDKSVKFIIVKRTNGKQQNFRFSIKLVPEFGN